MFTILKSLRAGVVTTDYPAVPSVPPERFRGAPAFRAGAPFAALPPAERCPTGAISLEPGPPGRSRIDLAKCVFCGRCADLDPTAPIALGRDFELAARQRGTLVIEAAADAAGRIAPAPAPPSEERVAAAIRKTLGRSLQLRHLDAGSCNACDWELAALLNPVYDVRRLGIDVVASPRHADGLLVTGPVTRNLELAVQRTYEAVPEPRLVIAVGACACSGGIVGSSYASAGGVDQVLTVDAYIPGCPPRPQAIIFGLLVAVGRLQARQDRTNRPAR